MLIKTCVFACVLCCFSNVQLCDPMDCSANTPSFSVHGISQARILEWIAHTLLKGLSPTQGSNLGLLYILHWQAGSLPLVQAGKSG